MAKLKFTEKNGTVCIICRTTGSEALNEAEYNYFRENRIKGWLVPSSVSADRLEFTGAQGVPLINVLKHGVDKKLYYRIVSQLLTILDTAASCGFNMQNIVLDPDFIIMDTSSKELCLFYLPLWYNESTNDGVVNCLRRISTYAQYISDEDYDSVDGFMNFVCRAEGFKISEAMERIRREIPEIFPAQNRPVQQARPEFSRPEPVQQKQPKHLAPLQNGGSHETFAPKTEKPAYKPEPKVIPAISDEKKQPLPELRKNELPRKEVKYPTLTRRATGVTVNIDKPVFRIGKERDRVDFCITENRTVSRLHATIYTRNSSCFVEDNNSTNRTYINGTPVLPDREIKLKNGDVLKLSNEEFDFTDG